MATSPSIRSIEHLHGAADLLREPLGADLGGEFHEARAALGLDFRGDRGSSQRIGRRALDRRILEAADAIELRRAQPVEQLLEVLRRSRPGNPR